MFISRQTEKTPVPNGHPAAWRLRYLWGNFIDGVPERYRTGPPRGAPVGRYPQPLVSACPLFLGRIPDEMTTYPAPSFAALYVALRGSHMVCGSRLFMINLS